MHGNIDPIGRDVFQQQLVGIAEEMSMALRRAAFSSIIWDMYDYACGHTVRPQIRPKRID